MCLHSAEVMLNRCRQQAPVWELVQPLDALLQWQHCQCKLNSTRYVSSRHVSSSNAGSQAALNLGALTEAASNVTPDVAFLRAFASENVGALGARCRIVTELNSIQGPP